MAQITLDTQFSITSASMREFVQKAKDGLAARSEYESQSQLAVIGWQELNSAHQRQIVSLIV